jgi:hypothetical protein
LVAYSHWKVDVVAPGHRRNASTTAADVAAHTEAIQGAMRGMELLRELRGVDAHF